MSILLNTDNPTMKDFLKAGAYVLIPIAVIVITFILIGGLKMIAAILGITLILLFTAFIGAALNPLYPTINKIIVTLLKPFANND